MFCKAHEVICSIGGAEFWFKHTEFSEADIELQNHKDMLSFWLYQEFQ